jgi:CCR4-NOT transcription complex subunit 6
LKSLKILWLNDNPLREVPVEIGKCIQLKELDLKNTYVLSLPREMSNLTNLKLLSMEGCPMKDSLNTLMGDTGVPGIHSDLRRKDDRRIYKERIFDKLTEWIYPS